MPQSHCHQLIHIIFSTKDRTKYIKPPIRQELYAYIATILRALNCECYRVGGVEDHVHLAVRLHSTGNIADLVEKMKANSSNWMKKKGLGLEFFSWQKGYGAFSVSPQYRKQLIDYIDNQEKHHKGLSFQDEYRTLLQKYDIAFDEKYLWD